MRFLAVLDNEIKLLPFFFKGLMTTRLEVDNYRMSSEKKPVFLVVDDCPNTRDMLRTLFEKAGASVLLSASGGEAIETFKQTPELHVLVTDIRMPEMNGEEVIKAFRDLGFSGKIIALTATATGHGRGGSIRSGADTYLSKQSISKRVVESLVADARAL